MERHITALALVLGSKPDLPVNCLRPHAATTAASFFTRHFPGETLYAVKANPHPLILDAVYAGGVRWFDVASIPEIEMVASRFADARMAFMHPVKSRSAIRAAYFDYGVRVFAVDCAAELTKIMDETGGARDLHIIVRLAASSDFAAHKLEGKFGADPAEGAALLRAARAAADELGVSFHVGSQCMRPEAWRRAMREAGAVIRSAGVTVDIVDVGGGFPCQYEGAAPPPLMDYFDAIKAAFEEMPVLFNADLWCEPGRALCAEAASQLVRVELRKDDALYINDGAYGALFDAAHDGLRFPARLVRADGAASPLAQGYRLFGPTCDAIDRMEGPFMLPVDVAEGDYLEIGLTGAYGAALATPFNGFGVFQEAILDDAPMTSMYNEPQTAPAETIADQAN